jgi:hypothetical protein
MTFQEAISSFLHLNFNPGPFEKKLYSVTAVTFNEISGLRLLFNLFRDWGRVVGYSIESAVKE